MTKSKSKKNYFKLPFEVYYGDELPITSLQFKSDVTPELFGDIKAVHLEQGDASGVTFRCLNNSGSELFCCIMNDHDEVDPDWLKLKGDGDINFNYSSNLIVKIEGDEIKFSEPSDDELDEDSEEYVDFDLMDYCCDAMMAYHLADCSPSYLILDADESRIKVNLDGFVLNEDDIPTDEQLFNPEDLDEEEYSDYSRLDLWEAKWDWVNDVLTSNFPKEKHLKLSLDTE